MEMVTNCVDSWTKSRVVDFSRLSSLADERRKVTFYKPVKSWQGTRFDLIFQGKFTEKHNDILRLTYGVKKAILNELKQKCRPRLD